MSKRSMDTLHQLLSLSDPESMILTNEPNVTVMIRIFLDSYHIKTNSLLPMKLFSSAMRPMNRQTTASNSDIRIRKLRLVSDD